MYLADPLRMLSEKKLKSMQLLWYTLNVIQTINPDNDFDASKALFELFDAVNDGRLFEIL